MLLHPVWLALLCVFVALSLFAFVMIIVRRNHEMIKIRVPVLMLVQVISGLVCVTMICVRESMRDTFPCWVYIVTMNMFTPFYFLPMFYQAIMIKHVSTHKSVDAESGYVSGFSSNLRRQRGIFFALSGMIISIHAVAAAVQMAFVSHNGTLWQGCAWDSELEYICMAIVSGVYAVAFAVVTFWILRRTRNSYALRNDLRIAFSWCVLCTTLFFIFNLVPPLWDLDDYFPFSSIIYIMITGLLLFMLLRPAILASRSKYKNTMSRLLMRRDLLYKDIIDFVDDDAAYGALQEWCTDNGFSTEPLDMLADSYSYNNTISQGLKRFGSSQLADLRSQVRRVVDFVHNNEILPVGSERHPEAVTFVERASMDAVLNAQQGLPSCQQFKPYFSTVVVICNKDCVERFYGSDRHTLLVKKARRDGIYARNLRSAFDDQDSYSSSASLLGDI